MTAPTSRQLRLAMSLARPPTEAAWSVLGWVAEETIDFTDDPIARHLAVPASGRSLHLRLGWAPSTGVDAVKALVRMRVLERIGEARGSAPPVVRVNGAFGEWLVSWRPGKDLALSQLADASCDHPMDWSERRFCDRSISRSLRIVKGQKPLVKVPVRWVVGEFVPDPWTGHNAPLLAMVHDRSQNPGRRRGPVLIPGFDFKTAVNSRSFAAGGDQQQPDLEVEKPTTAVVVAAINQALGPKAPLHDDPARGRYPLTSVREGCDNITPELAEWAASQIAGWDVARFKGWYHLVERALTVIAQGPPPAPPPDKLAIARAEAAAGTITPELHEAGMAAALAAVRNTGAGGGR